MDFPVHESEKSEIIADTDTVTGMKPRTDLPDEDISCQNSLAAKFFDTPSLPVGITTIAAGSLTFLMRHCILNC